VEIHFKLFRITKGALRYQECDKQGVPIGSKSARIGALYVRKTAFNGSVPSQLTIDLVVGNDEETLEHVKVGIEGI